MTAFQTKNQHLRPRNAGNSNYIQGVCNILHESTSALAGGGGAPVSASSSFPASASLARAAVRWGRMVRTIRCCGDTGCRVCRWGLIQGARRGVLRLALDNRKSGQDARLWTYWSSATARPLQRIVLPLPPTSAVPILPRRIVFAARLRAASKCRDAIPSTGRVLLAGLSELVGVSADAVGAVGAGVVTCALASVGGELEDAVAVDTGAT
jgi:hypothetical protein